MPTRPDAIASSMRGLVTSTCEVAPAQPVAGGGGGDMVMFVTETFIGSDDSAWLYSRDEANTYCADYAASNGIAGSDFRIVYSHPGEDARDFLPDMGPDTMVYDRDGALVVPGSLFGGADFTLPDMKPWTITGTQSDGAYLECDGVYEPGTWPICQYCDQKFACGTTGDNPLAPSACCWSGTRAIVCLGTR